jgi:hypothetical protein
LVGVGVGVFRLVAAPFLAAADLAAALRPVVPAGRRALLPLAPFAPPRPDPPAAPRPLAEPPLRPLPLVPLPPVPVLPPRLPDRLAEVPAFDPALRPEPPPAAPLRPPLDRPDPPEPELVPRLAPRLPPPPGGTLGRITSGDSSL